MGTRSGLVVTIDTRRTEQRTRFRVPRCPRAHQGWRGSGPTRARRLRARSSARGVPTRRPVRVGRATALVCIGIAGPVCLSGAKVPAGPAAESMGAYSTALALSLSCSFPGATLSPSLFPLEGRRQGRAAAAVLTFAWGLAWRPLRRPHTKSGSGLWTGGGLRGSGGPGAGCGGRRMGWD